MHKKEKGNTETYIEFVLDLCSWSQGFVSQNCLYICRRFLDLQCTALYNDYHFLPKTATTSIKSLNAVQYFSMPKNFLFLKQTFELIDKWRISFMIY